MSPRAFSGLKVVELASQVSGPCLGKLLADFGAEVIKVEIPPGGDEARSLGPFPGDVPHPEKSGMFLYLNTNKLGVTLNPGNAAGRRILLELIKEADVFIENYPPLVIEEWGLSYPRLKEVNPRLVMASLTPFGQSGPYRDYESSPLIIYSLGGIAYETPSGGVGKENLEKMPPLKGWGWQYSYTCAHNAAWGVTAALLTRESTGQGQHVDASELEAAAAILRPNAPQFSYMNPPYSPLSQPEGWSTARRSVLASLVMYPCKDGYVNIGATDDLQFARWKKVMGNPEWAEAEIFATMLSRQDNGDALHTLASQWTLQHTKEDITRWMQEGQTICFPVYTPEDVVNDEHNQVREVIVEIDHPVAGRVKFPGAPFKASATPWQVERPAPQLGEHNEQVFGKRLGYSKEDLVALRVLGAI